VAQVVEAEWAKLGCVPRALETASQRRTMERPPVCVAEDELVPPGVVGSGTRPTLSERFDPQLIPRHVRLSINLRSKTAYLQRLCVIGETGFEPATARPPAGCATRLRHSPWHQAGDRNRTGPKSLEGFCAATTLRPHARGHVTGAVCSRRPPTNAVPPPAPPPTRPPGPAAATVPPSCREPRRA
jgi:hypothetical protein